MTDNLSPKLDYSKTTLDALARWATNQDTAKPKPDYRRNWRKKKATKAKKIG